jgi:hypothetical protein
VIRIRILVSAVSVVMTSVALTVGTAQARMYQWQSASTGSAQLSGEPPAWYRSEQGGPRVRVFENGNLIDDTVIALPRGQREKLREEAFRESEQRQRAAAVQRLERLALQQQRRRVEQERLAAEKLKTDAQLAQQSGNKADNAQPQTPISSLSPDQPLDEATVARLKAIIGEFDRQTGQSK